MTWIINQYKDRIVNIDKFNSVRIDHTCVGAIDFIKNDPFLNLLITGFAPINQKTLQKFHIEIENNQIRILTLFSIHCL